MKKHLLLINTMLLSLMLINTSAAQDLYALNFSDPSDYTITGGTILNNKWIVNNAYGSLITSDIRYPGTAGVDPAMIAPVCVTIISGEKMGCGETYPDGAFIKYSVNNGAWFTQRYITPCEFASKGKVITNFKIYAPAGATVRIMVLLASVTDQLSIKDKDHHKDAGILVGPAEVANSSNWTKRNASLASVNTSIASGISVFPNPSKGDNISFRITSEPGETVTLNLVDMLGRNVYTSTFTANSSEAVHNLNTVQKLAPGTYVMIGTLGETRFKQMLIVQGE